MKKLLVILAMFALLANVSFGQSSASTTATVSVSIIKALTIQNAAGNLAFPEIIMNGTQQTESISNQNGVRFLVTGHPNRNVTVTYDATVTLDNNAWVTTYGGGDQGTITFTTNTASQTGSSTTYTNPQDLTSGSTLPLVNVTGTGRLNIWVGGELTAASNQPQGDYVGTFDISVHY